MNFQHLLVIFIIITCIKLSETALSSNNLTSNTGEEVRADKSVGGNFGSVEIKGSSRISSNSDFSSRRLFPLIKQRPCEKGETFKINNEADLRLLKYKSELECIFQCGLTPNKIPMGRLEGKPVSTVISRSVNNLGMLLWKGKMVTRYECKNPNAQDTRYNTYHIGFNIFFRTFTMIPFVASIGPVKDPLGFGEVNDGRDSLIVDYTQNFVRTCGETINFIEEGFTGPRVKGYVYPFNRIMDRLRIVGRQEDGGAIYLGTTYFKDSLGRFDRLLYFSLVNYDPEVREDFKAGDLIQYHW